MTLEPHLHLLGVEDTADPATLLGMTQVDARDPLLIDRALRLRLAQVYQHPDHRAISNADMQLVLRSLRDAAEQLRSEVRRRGPIRQPKPWVLTEFDRNALAVLVGYGGWNAKSRSRLVALAAAQNVTPHGLMRVIEGLGEYAKSGGPALPISEIKPSPAMTATNGLSRSPAISDAILDRFLPELKEPSTRTTVKLSVLFGALTLLVGVLALRFLLPAHTPPPQSETETATSPSVQAPTPRTADSIGESRTPTRGAPPGRLAMDQRPTFRGQPHPAVALEYRVAMAEEFEALDEVARRLTVSHDPAEIVYRNWSVAIERIGSCWPLLDAAVQERAEVLIIDVLFTAAEAPTVTDRLLTSLTPPVGRLLQPLDVWRGAWSAGTLATIASHEHLPPAVRDRARRQLRVAVGDAWRPDAAQDRIEPASTAAARIFLAQVMPQIVEHVEFEQAAYDYWELWLAALQRTARGEQYTEALLDAAEAIVKQHRNLSRSSRALNVLGRLLEEADFRESQEARQRLLAWIDAQAISSDSMWAVTNILGFEDAATPAIAPWFVASMIVPPDADMSVRSRIRHDVQRRWTLPDAPGAAAAAMQVDDATATQWHGWQTLTHDEPIAPRPVHMMQQLLIAARLNEAAAYLAIGEHRRAARRLGDIVGLASSDPAARDAQQRPPAMPADGQWAARYEEVRRNTDEKLQLLQSLRNSQARDMGPIDASVLVREVYRGTPAEVRAAAQAVLMERMRSGPNVAIEMLDQFPDAGRSQAVSDLVSEYTGKLLPLLASAGRSTQAATTWAAEARMALIDHALSLRSAPHEPIDQMAQQLAESYADQAQALLGMLRSEGHPLHPSDAGEQLLDAWTQVARNVAGVDLASYEYRAMAGRHAVRHGLAEGGVQRFVAHQLSALELLASVVVHEQPQLRGEVDEVLRGSARRRSSPRHVLEQAVEAERAMNVLWRMRMGLPESSSDEGDAS